MCEGPFCKMFGNIPGLPITTPSPKLLTAPNVCRGQSDVPREQTHPSKRTELEIYPKGLAEVEVQLWRRKEKLAGIMDIERHERKRASDE